MDIQLHLGDCLDILPTLPDKCADAIITDLPYGTTSCKWDVIIPFDAMWTQVKRVMKDFGAFVTTANQPFESSLINSNLEWFKYCWIWDKKMPPDFYAAKYRPLTQHEDVVVFSPAGASYGSEKLMSYNPIMTERDTPRIYKDAYRANRKNPKSDSLKVRPVYEGVLTHRYPKTILEFSTAHQGKKEHPTQKPVALYEYLIKTYTNPGDTVLDFCAGSGTTGVAAIRTGRNAILIEKDPGYFAIMERRVHEVQQIKML